MAYRNRSRARVVMNSPVTLVLALVLFAFMARAAWNIHGKASASSDRLSEAQSSLAKLEANKAGTQAKIDDLSSDAGIEASIREKYHAVQPGESVAVIIDDEPSGASPATSSDQGNWLSRLMRSIGF